MIIDRLYNDVKNKGPVCAGLDTQLGFLPGYLVEKSWTPGEKIFEFNRRIMDAVKDDVGCFKVQIACYEALGLDGMQAFAKTVAYGRNLGCVVISDVKRGDIASTAKQYAQAHFTGDFETDIITVNAYMGEDAISPYYEYLNDREKGLFVLVKTSNPSGVDFQDMDMGGMTLYERMAERVSAWGEGFLGGCGFSSIGAVAGCTYPEEFERVRARMPHTFFLIPGYGAQGGTGEDIARFFKDGVCGVVNSSRGLICAHRGKTDGADYVNFVRDAVRAMKEDIARYM